MSGHPYDVVYLGVTLLSVAAKPCICIVIFVICMCWEMLGVELDESCLWSDSGLFDVDTVEHYVKHTQTQHGLLLCFDVFVGFVVNSM